MELVNLPPRFRNGARVTESSAVLSFDLAEATKHLAERDVCLKRLIEETLPFQIDVADAQSPYEALLESIAYQSISGKAAATIFGRIKALSSTGRAPTPQERLGHHLRQKAHAQAQGTPRFRRTLASLPHCRQLVHVACLPARRQHRHAQNPPRTTTQASPIQILWAR